jgi:hypothetical protein
MVVPDLLRGRRGAFIALGVASLAFALLVIAPLVALFEAQQSDIEDSLGDLANYQAEVALRPQLETRLHALEQTAKSVPGLLAGNNAELAQAQLQSDMKSLIGENGGTLLSAQLLQPTSANGFDMVAIQYDLTVPLTHLKNLIYAVETHTPYYFVDDADMIMPPNWRPDNPQAPDPALEVRWTVHAFRWNGSK